MSLCSRGSDEVVSLVLVLGPPLLVLLVLTHLLPLPMLLLLLL